MLLRFSHQCAAELSLRRGIASNALLSFFATELFVCPPFPTCVMHHVRTTLQMVLIVRRCDICAERLVQRLNSTKRGATHTYDMVARCLFSMAPRKSLTITKQVLKVRYRAEVHPWISRGKNRPVSSSTNNTSDNRRAERQLLGQTARGRRL